MGDDFSDLLRRAKCGDVAASTQLHARYERLVRGIVRRRLGPTLRRRYDADDLVQSVFADVLTDLPRFEDRGEGAFRHWISLRTETKVASKVRKQLRPGGGRREETLAGEEGPTARAPGPATQAGDADAAGRLRRSLNSLDPTEREVLMLREEAGLEWGTIAGRLGLSSPDAARMRYARALLALKARYDRG